MAAANVQDTKRDTKKYGKEKSNYDANIEILKKQLKSKELSNIYLLYGPEEYLKKYYLNAIAKLMPDNDFSGMNNIIFEGKPDFGKIIDSCESLPIFSEKKLVIIKNSGVFKQKRNTKQKEDTSNSEESKNSENPENREKSGNPEKSEMIESNADSSDNSTLLLLLENIPEYTCLIFYENEITETSKAVNIINKKGLVVKFPLQKSEELARWVMKICRADQKEIDLHNALKIVEMCEHNMNELINEVNKVILFSEGRNIITESDIDAVCTRSIKSRIFDLTDAASARDAEKTLIFLNELLILKEPFQLILFMLTKHFRQLLEVKLIIEEGFTVNEAAAKMQISPYIAGKLLKQASRFGIPELENMHENCFELDFSIKKGLIGFRTGIELLIAGIAAK